MKFILVAQDVSYFQFSTDPEMQMRFSWTGSGPFYINSMTLEYLI